MKLSHVLNTVVKAIILGPPGSGKATISLRLKKDFPVDYIGCGDLLRRHVVDKTEFGVLASSYIQEGSLVPDNIVTKLVMKNCEKYVHSNLLIDGFPRTVNQAKEIEKYFPVSCVLNLDVPFDEIINRLKGRSIHLRSGRIYNNDFNPPKRKGLDDITGEPLTQRQDDQPETVHKRLEYYQQTVTPLLDFYSEKNILHTFHGRSSNELWPKIHEAFSKFIKPLKYTEYN